MIHMVTKRKRERLLYRASSVRKMVYAVLLLFLLWGTIVTLSDPFSKGSLAIPLFCILLCIAGISYRESWSFEPGKQRVVSLFGFGPLVKRTTFSYGEIKTLSLSHFVKGDAKESAKADRKRYKKSMVVFSLVTKDDGEHTIEIIPERTSQGKTEDAAKAISSFSMLPLEIDRPIDRDLVVPLSEI